MAFTTFYNTSKRDRQNDQFSEPNQFISDRIVIAKVHPLLDMYIHTANKEDPTNKTADNKKPTNRL